jgi:DNA-binding winged helix-turn-helix (wHTH) protein/Tol biopolymer transport system component
LRDRVFRFGTFEVSEHEGELRKNGARIKLQEQPFRVLVELVANAGRLVCREELQQKLWPSDTFVDFDVGLNTAISKLRQALGDEADEPRYIETLSKRGYRFIAPVSEVGAGLPSNEIRAPSAGVDTPIPGTVSPSRESGGVPVSPAVRSKQRWYWVLGASVAVVLLILGLNVARRGTSRPPALGTEQRITANPQEAPIGAAVVSPDGKFVAYSDTTGVYVRHINTGETRPVKLPKDFHGSPSSWFPDNTNLLLTRPPPTGTEEPSLWRASILGESPQKLIDQAFQGTVSPDGSRIAFIRTPYDAEEVWVVGTDGSTPRRVVEHTLTPLSGGTGTPTVKRQYARSFLSSPAWSPDGSRIAYVRLFRTSAPEPAPAAYYALETVAADGGTPKVLRSSAQFLPSICWTADGRLIYPYREDGSGSGSDFGIWSLRVNQKSGESMGEPRPISKGYGQVDWLSASADGKRLTFLRMNIPK